VTLSVNTLAQKLRSFTAHLLTYLLIYLLTYLRSRALLEKPPIVQPLKNFPAFYGTRRFITVFTRAVVHSRLRTQNYDFIENDAFDFAYISITYGLLRYSRSPSVARTQNLKCRLCVGSVCGTIAFLSADAPRAML
jgi:hypothetical protein